MAESLFSTLHKKMHILVALSCLGLCHILQTTKCDFSSSTRHWSWKLRDTFLYWWFLQILH